MANQKNEKAAIPADVAEKIAPTADTSENKETAFQIRELREMTSSLLSAFQEMQNQNSRNKEFQDAVLDIKATKNAIILSTGANKNPVPLEMANPQNEDCGCGCGCVSEDCCTFEIKLKEVRVLNMQIEPLDSPAGLMEIRMFASIDGIGAVIPNMFHTISLHKLINQQGVWTQVNQLIGVVTVKKGVPKLFNLRIDAVEVEETLLEQVAGLRDEYGTNSEPVTLDCCSTVPIIKEFDISFTGGGQGRGAISVRFEAIRK